MRSAAVFAVHRSVGRQIPILSSIYHSRDVDLACLGDAGFLGARVGLYCFDVVFSVLAVFAEDLLAETVLLLVSAGSAETLLPPSEANFNVLMTGLSPPLPASAPESAAELWSDNSDDEDPFCDSICADCPSPIFWLAGVSEGAAKAEV